MKAYRVTLESGKKYPIRIAYADCTEYAGISASLEGEEMPVTLPELPMRRSTVRSCAAARAWMTRPSAPWRTGSMIGDSEGRDQSPDLVGGHAQLLLKPPHEVLFLSLFQEKIFVSQTRVQSLELSRDIVPDALHPEHSELTLPGVRKSKRLRAFKGMWI